MWVSSLLTWAKFGDAEVSGWNKRRDADPDALDSITNRLSGVLTELL
jgi:hypothetical protein